MIRRTAVLLALFAALARPAGAGDADEGGEIFNTICAICHQLPDPSFLRISQWKVVLETMRKRMEQKGMVPLSEDEERKVLEYLKKNTKR
ncbi:MAG: c-type cytochrome [Candidatus Nitrospinota bacterium M3_3B_026]